MIGGRLAGSTRWDWDSIGLSAVSKSSFPFSSVLGEDLLFEQGAD